MSAAIATDLIILGFSTGLNAVQSSAPMPSIFQPAAVFSKM